MQTRGSKPESEKGMMEKMKDKVAVAKDTAAVKAHDMTEKVQDKLPGSHGKAQDMANDPNRSTGEGLHHSAPGQTNPAGKTTMEKVKDKAHVAADTAAVKAHAATDRAQDMLPGDHNKAEHMAHDPTRSTGEGLHHSQPRGHLGTSSDTYTPRNL